MNRFKLFFSTAILLGSSFLASAQVIYKDRLPYSDSAEVQAYYRAALCIQDSLYALGLPTHTLEIIELDTGIFLVVDGRLHLFRWEQNDWVDRSRSKHHGHNFRSIKFGWKGLIYNYGGYGFWREHGGLIYFDWNHQEWEASPILSDFDIGSNVGFIRDSLLMIFNPVSRNQYIDRLDKNSGLYQIDLNTKAVQVFEIDPELDGLRFGSRIETENYYLPSRDPFQIIDKRRMRYKFSELTYMRKLAAHTNRSLFYIHGDSLSLQFSDTSDAVRHYDFDHLYKQVVAIEKSIYKPSRFPYTSIGLILLLAFVGYWMIKRNSRQAKTRVFKHPLIEPLLAYSGKELSQEELDILFGIDQINPAETQRSKRSSMFKDINEEYQAVHGKKLIERVPDPMDRRKFRYTIHNA